MESFRQRRQRRIVLLILLSGVAAAVTVEPNGADMELVVEAASPQSVARPLVLHLAMKSVGTQPLEYEAAVRPPYPDGGMFFVEVTDATGSASRQPAWNGYPRYFVTLRERVLPGQTVTVPLLTPTLAAGSYRIAVATGPRPAGNALPATSRRSAPVEIVVAASEALAAAYDDQLLSGVRAGDTFWSDVVRGAGAPAELRDRELEQLGKATICSASALRGLADDVGSDDPQRVNHAAWALAGYQPAVPGTSGAIAKAIAHRIWERSPDSTSPPVMALILIRLADSSDAVESLIALTTDRVQSIRIRALLALSSRCADAKVAAALRAATTAQDRNTREAALSALAPTRDPELLEPLLDAASIHDMTAPTKDVVFHALTWYDDAEGRALIERTSHGSSAAASAARTVLDLRAKWPLPIPKP
jgi:hypothetical protein